MQCLKPDVQQINDRPNNFLTKLFGTVRQVIKPFAEGSNQK